MANSIDWGTLALGALVGVGCKEQLKAAGRVAAQTAASLASAAAQAAASVAAQETVERINRNIDQPTGNGQG